MLIPFAGIILKEEEEGVEEEGKERRSSWLGGWERIRFLTAVLPRRKIETAGAACPAREERLDLVELAERDTVDAVGELGVVVVPTQLLDLDGGGGGRDDGRM